MPRPSRLTAYCTPKRTGRHARPPARAGSFFGPIQSSRRDDKAARGSPDGSFFRPRRVRAEVPPCGPGSLENRRRRAAVCARGAAPPCGRGWSESRRRRAVGSRFLRFLVNPELSYLAAATGSIKRGSFFLTLPTRVAHPPRAPRYRRERIEPRRELGGEAFGGELFGGELRLPPLQLVVARSGRAGQVFAAADSRAVSFRIGGRARTGAP